MRLARIIFAAVMVVAVAPWVYSQRDDIVARFRNGQIAAEPETVTVRLEFVGVRGDSVVIMAVESFRPGPKAPNAGKLIGARCVRIPLLDRLIARNVQARGNPLSGWRA